MNKMIVLFFIMSFISSSVSYAQLDLDQDVLVIPDTHDAEPYRWKKPWTTWGYDIRLEYGDLTAGTDVEFIYSIKTRKSRTVTDVHVFIADEGLHTFSHVRPEYLNGKYRFIYNAPSQGGYRLEFVFKTEDGWINLREDISVTKGVNIDLSLTPLLSIGKSRDGYSVNVRQIPDKVYSEHVVTFLYEISLNGVLLKDFEKTDGVDIFISSWDKRLKQFISAGSRQNVDGQVAASIVFMRPGIYRVFAEFRNKGEVIIAVHEIEVFLEPPQKQGQFFESDPYK